MSFIGCSRTSSVCYCTPVLNPVTRVIVLGNANNHKLLTPINFLIYVVTRHLVDTLGF